MAWRQYYRGRAVLGPLGIFTWLVDLIKKINQEKSRESINQATKRSTKRPSIDAVVLNCFLPGPSGVPQHAQTICAGKRQLKSRMDKFCMSALPGDKLAVSFAGPGPGRKQGGGFWPARSSRVCSPDQLTHLCYSCMNVYRNSYQ